MQRGRVVVVTGATLAVAGVAWLYLYLMQPWTTPPPEIAPVPLGPPSDRPKAPAGAGASMVALPPRASGVPDANAARQRLQERLDALALAYEKADWRAAERAMWPNHAVVRPDGELMERQQLRETWHEEWQGLQNRDLRFYVERYDVKGNVVAAQWTILLTADLTDASGEVHHMMINGIQSATLVGDGEEQQLDGPIVYTAFERTLNGNVWPTD